MKTKTGVIANFVIRDRVWARIDYKDGRVEFRKGKENSFTSEGLTLLVQSVLSHDEQFIEYGAVGTGTSTPQTSDTELETEIFRTALSVITFPSAGKAHVEFIVDYTDANGNTLTEVAIFNDPETGVMLLRELFDVPIEKTSDKKVTVFIEFTGSSA